MAPAQNRLAGSVNLAGKLFGECFGTRCHGFLLRWIMPLVAVVIVVELSMEVVWYLEASFLPVFHIASVFGKLAFLVPWYLSLRVDCLQRLFKKLAVWNAIASMCVALACTMHHYKGLGWTMYISCFVDFSLRCIFPLIDAMHPAIVSQRTRVAACLVVAAVHVWLYIDTRLSSTTFYNKGKVLELKVEGHTVFSSLGWRRKGLLFITAFLLHMLYHSMLHRDSAFVLQQRVLLTTLHSRTKQNALTIGRHSRPWQASSQAGSI